MSHWVRLWDDMPTDPKWRVIARRSGRPITEVIAVFCFMLTNAGAACERGTLDGWNDEDVGAALDMDAEVVSAIREAMQGKTLDGERLTGWERRQPKRERDDDNSAERVKAFREKQRHVTPRNADVTPCNATKRLDKIREDKIIEADASIAFAPAKSDLESECRKLVGEEPVLLALDFHVIAKLVDDGTVTQADVLAGIRAAMAKPGFRIRHWSQLEGWARGAAKDRLAGKAKTNGASSAGPAKPLIWIPQGSDSYEAWKQARPKAVKAMLTERGGVFGIFMPTKFPPTQGATHAA